MRTPYWTVIVRSQETYVPCCASKKKACLQKSAFVRIKIFLRRRSPQPMSTCGWREWEWYEWKHEIFTFRRAPIHQSTIVSVVRLTQRQRMGLEPFFPFVKMNVLKTYTPPLQPMDLYDVNWALLWCNHTCCVWDQDRYYAETVHTGCLWN